jgi:hypothetical protein
MLMTEAEWLACTDPAPMLEFLRDKTSDRKLRLFASACCRRIWPLLTDERSRRGVEVTERYVDGLASEEERDLARQEACAAAAAACRIESGSIPGGGVYAYPAHDVAWFAASAASDVPDYGRFRRPGDAAEGAAAAAANATLEAAYQATLLRDIIGSPFGPSPPLPATMLSWNDSTVRRIAEGIYDDRAFDRLPILSDALLDAGCDNEDLIQHCRSAGPHVRGCWAVDLILGKS